VAQHHTLFPNGDTDYMSFQAEPGKSYAVETFKLTNGADTYLEIRYVNMNGVEMLLLDPSTSKPYTNDNPADRVFSEGCAQLDANFNSLCPNNETTFASKLVITNFTPPADCASPCTLYARVTRSPITPPSTGRYGSYNFKVTQVTSP
jgi:hypothetical protein